MLLDLRSLVEAAEIDTEADVTTSSSGGQTHATATTTGERFGGFGGGWTSTPRPIRRPRRIEPEPIVARVAAAAPRSTTRATAQSGARVDVGAQTGAGTTDSTTRQGVVAGVDSRLTTGQIGSVASIGVGTAVASRSLRPATRADAGAVSVARVRSGARAGASRAATSVGSQATVATVAGSRRTSATASMILAGEAGALIRAGISYAHARGGPMGSVASTGRAGKTAASGRRGFHDDPLELWLLGITDDDLALAS